MPNIKELNEYVLTGHRLFYTDYDSLWHFRNQAESVLPKGYSLFIWTPYKLKCIRYCRNGSASRELRSRFNDKNTQDLDFGELLKMAKNVVLRDLEQLPRDPENTIPKNSIILCINSDSDLKSPATRTDLQEITSYPAYANYGIHFIMYSDNPITDRFLTQHGIELKTPAMSTEALKNHIKERAKAEAGRPSFLNNPDIVSKLVESLQGMTPEIVDSVVDWGIAFHRETDDAKVLTNHADKMQARIIKQSEMLSFLPVEEQIDPKFIGGFSAFLNYMQESAIGFSAKARELHLDPPKGVVLLGLPGTGKTMAAKALGNVLNLRTVVLDMSSAFGSLVGESESRIRKALKQVEDFGRCILLIDEADKALAGATGSIGDSGTTRRVLGTLLSWLQEQRSEIFVVLTMNDATVVPPEFLRAGRFDKIFYSDLPEGDSRKDIIRMQFARRGITDFELLESQWESLVHATRDFTGAELEEVVKESQRLAFQVRGKSRPTFEEIYSKAKGRVPMARFDKERIDIIRKFCEERATPVSGKLVVKTTPQDDVFSY